MLPGKTKGNVTKIALKTLPSASYILKIVKRNKELKTFKGVISKN